MYQQLTDEKNILTNFDVLAEAFRRIIHGRSNIVWEGSFLSTVGLIYGGVHLATWNNHFETDYERYAWRVCSVVTAVAVLGFVLMLCIGAFMKSIIDTFRTKTSKTGTLEAKATTQTKAIPQTDAKEAPAKLSLWKCYTFFVAIACYIGFIIVIHARLFLLVESFIALRGQPYGVYDTTDWVESMPDIS